METSKLLHEKVSEQITQALDGRTRRWLSFEVRISEQDISRKMNGHIDWNDGDLEKIEERLSFKIDRN